jgi:hypothetical protein
MATLNREAFARDLAALTKTMDELDTDGSLFDLSNNDPVAYYKILYDFLETHGYYIGRRGYNEGGMRID